MDRRYHRLMSVEDEHSLPFVIYNPIRSEEMKQRFLNQKLGKRNSRRAEINKAKRLLNKPQPLPSRKKS